MNFGAIFVGIAILVVTIPYVINPLVNERKKRPVNIPSLKKGEKDGQKQALEAIRTLDFDFHTGKVTHEDYEALRAQLVLEAAEYLQRKQQEDERVEALIHAHQQKTKPPAKCEKCGGDLLPQDLFCPACGGPANDCAPPPKPEAPLTCQACGKTIKASDLYCTGCGSRVNVRPDQAGTFAEN